MKLNILAKNLYLMGIAAHQYALHAEILPSILNLEILLKDDIVQEMMEDPRGDLIKKSFNVVETRMNGTNAETFTDFVNMYIFGRSLKTKDNVIKAKVESEEIKDSIIKVNLSKPPKDNSEEIKQQSTIEEEVVVVNEEPKVPRPPWIGGTINCFGKRLIEFDSIIHFVRFVCPAVIAPVEAM